MTKKTKLLLGAVVMASTLVYLIVGGIREAAVYYITPTELKEKGSATTDRAFRLGGMVVDGTRRWDPQTLKLTFRLSDGKEQVAVEYVGSPPDLFKEGSGAIVEGKYVNSLFHAETIMAKHSEEYRPPEKGQIPAKDHYRTLVKPPATRP